MSKTTFAVLHGSQEKRLKIGDISLECYVLEDKRRVLLSSDIQNVLGMAAGGSMVPGRNRLELFASRERIRDFLSPAAHEKLAAPIRIRRPEGNVAYALEAEILPTICEAVVSAARLGILQDQQLFIAHQCEVILAGLSRVGIDALVDEATGYQKVREENELQRLLDAYILPEHRPWVKAVPMDFFRELFRVFGWQHRGNNQGPRYAGKLVRKLIYRHLPKQVLPILDEINPSNEKYQRRLKHHQLLTEGVGLEHFKGQMTGIMALLRASTNRTEFMRLYSRAYGPQLEMDLGEPA